MSATPSRMLTTPEAATYLRMSENALLTLRSRRKAPPAAKVGRKLLWPEDALVTWLEDRTERVA